MHPSGSGSVPCRSDHVQILCCGAPVQILVCPGRTSGLSPFSVLVSSWLVTCPGPRPAWETREVYLIYTQPSKSSRSSKPSVWVSFVCRAVGKMGAFTKIIHQWTVRVSLPTFSATLGIIFSFCQCDRRKMAFHCFHLHFLNYLTACIY